MAEDINVQIPTTEQEEKQEEQLQDLAEAIPSIMRPKSRTESFPTFASIMATQTQTHTLAASREQDRNYFIR
jgi:hypothetical protein